MAEKIQVQQLMSWMFDVLINGSSQHNNYKTKQKRTLQNQIPTFSSGEVSVGGRCRTEPFQQLHSWMHRNQIYFFGHSTLPQQVCRSDHESVPDRGSSPLWNDFPLITAIQCTCFTCRLRLFPHSELQTASARPQDGRCGRPITAEQPVHLCYWSRPAEAWPAADVISVLRALIQSWIRLAIFRLDKWIHPHNFIDLPPEQPRKHETVRPRLEIRQPLHRTQKQEVHAGWKGWFIFKGFFKAANTVNVKLICTFNQSIKAN